MFGTILALFSSIIGFYTGVSSFLNNDRQQNSDFKISLFTDLTQDNYYIFLMAFTSQFRLLHLSLC